jgi:plastocyanin
MRRITWLIALVLAAGALTAAGCGGDDNSSSGDSSSGGTGTSSDSGGSAPLTVTADPGGAISWDKSTLSAKAGKVTLKLDNQSSTPHAIEVEGNGVEEETETISPGSSAKLTVDLSKNGTYEVYCPIDGHRAMGMEAKLVVGGGSAGDGGGTTTTETKTKSSGGYGY